MDLTDETGIFAAVGSDERAFAELVDAFYARVEADPPLRALYPDELAPGKQHLAWFLIQRFGGPNHFNNRRGAPMLRRRHAEFAITREQAGRWLRCMRSAIDDVAVLAPYKELVMRYFTDAAIFLVNTDERGDAAIRSLPVSEPPQSKPVD